MMEEKLLKHLIKELKEKEQSLMMSLGDGGATDFAVYQNMCGQIRGLLYAQNLMIDLLRKMEKLNDE
jgi:hypothetical protein